MYPSFVGDRNTRVSVMALASLISNEVSNATKQANAKKISRDRLTFKFFHSTQKLYYQYAYLKVDETRLLSRVLHEASYTLEVQNTVNHMFSHYICAVFCFGLARHSLYIFD